MFALGRVVVGGVLWESGGGEGTLGSHNRGLQVLGGLFYGFHERHDGSMADWVTDWRCS